MCLSLRSYLIFLSANTAPLLFRAHASTEGVTAYIATSVAGFLLQKELDYLQGYQIFYC